MSNEILIKKLKNELKEVLKAYSSMEHLVEKREALFDTYLCLCEKSESLLFQSLDLKSLNEHENQIQICKKQLQQIDTELDKIEEVTSSDIEDIKNNLIELILIQHPKEKAIYNNFESELNRILSFDKNVQLTLALLSNLIEQLEIIQVARSNVKRKGIFSYIFGKSPNFLIGKAIRSINHFLQKDLPALKTIQSNSGVSLKSKYEHLIPLLETLEQNSNQSWGFKVLDTYFKNILDQLISVRCAFIQYEKVISTEKKSIQESFTNWIEKF